MQRINENDIARDVAALAAGRRETDISQTKEDIRHLLDLLGTRWVTDAASVVELIERHRPGHDGAGETITLIADVDPQP